MERSWIEISARNLRHNVEALRAILPPGCELMAVVKAQAYGHGASGVSRLLSQIGVRAFAVATIDEGIALRKEGICGAILILGYTDVCRAGDLQAYDLIQTVIDFPYAKALNGQKIAVKVHIKIDTGMHRLGIPASDMRAVEKVFSMQYLNVCGLYTHLSCAENRQAEGIAFTKKQAERFYDLLGGLRERGITIPKLHIQSSFGLLNFPQLAHGCAYVRAGIALYGAVASNADTVLKPDLRSVLSLKSRVVLIRTVAKGEGVGYDRQFVAGRDSRIAVIPIGYGDGVPRSLSGGNGRVLIRQKTAPIAGRVCMDQMMVDITGMEDVAVGDVVTLIGAQGENALSATDVAQAAGSIANELLCRMGARLPIVIKETI